MVDRKNPFPDKISQGIQGAREAAGLKRSKEILNQARATIDSQLIKREPGLKNNSAVRRFYNDPTDFLKIDKWLMIQFFHVPSAGTMEPLEPEIQFKSFITNFEDNYESVWNSEEVYGRMDPMQTFQRTKRTISLGWDVPADSLEEGVENMERISGLISMLYPGYREQGNANTIASAPVFKVKFCNLISSPNSSPSAPAQYGGLLCTVSGFRFSPEWKMGAFDMPNGHVIPKLYRLSTNLTILHEHSLGWKFDSDGAVINKSMERFPYGHLGQDPDVRERRGALTQEVNTLREVSVAKENILNEE